MNQTMQLYVNEAAVTPTDAGDGCIKFVTESGTTDIVDKSKIMWVSHTNSEALKPQVAQATVTITDASAGDYILRMTFRGVHGLSDGDQYIKYGTARATTSSTPTTLAAALADSLKRNAKRDVEPLFDAVASGATITITVKASEWKLGLFTGRVPQLEKNSFTFIGPDDDVEWASVVMSTIGADIPVSAKLADLEYFALGNRGDQYRNVGWPNVIHSEYKVDPNTEYECYVIHYYAISSNEAVQRSEKEIIILSQAECPEIMNLDPNTVVTEDTENTENTEGAE